MRSNILDYTYYEKTVKNLLAYHEEATNEICENLKFPKLGSYRFIAVRKNVEIGFVCSKLTEWEYQNVSKYGKNHVFQEYYPAIVDLAEERVVPRIAQSCGCNINYYYMFSPSFYGKIIYSFYIFIFDKPIFKKFHAQQSSLEQKIVTQISSFFYKKNKYGPEHISVSILDNQFLTIIISGLVTPFFQEVIHKSREQTDFVENMFTLQAKEILQQLLSNNFGTVIDKSFIYFDKKEDKLIILSSLSKEQWIKFITTMSA